MKVSYLVFAVCDMSDVRGLQYLLELNNMMHYIQNYPINCTHKIQDYHLLKYK